MPIIISFYNEATPIEFNDSSRKSFSEFSKTIFEECSFMKDTSNIKFYYIHNSSRVFIKDDASLKRFFALSLKVVYAIDEKFEQDILDNAPEEVNELIAEIDKIENEKKAEIRKINENFENQIKIFSQNLTSVMRNLLSEHASQQLSSLIKIPFFTPSDENSLHSPVKQCKICGLNPLKGNIYECNTCANYALCHQCFYRFKSQYFGHQKEHKFYMVTYDYALYKQTKAEVKKVPTEYIEDEMKKIKFQKEEAYKVQQEINPKIYWNYMDVETKSKEKLRIEFENIGTSNITNNKFSFLFGSEQFNVYKIDTDIPVDIKKKEKYVCEFAFPSCLKNKQVGVYYVPVGIAKSKNYIKGSLIVFEINIIIEVPDYQVLELEKEN